MYNSTIQNIKSSNSQNWLMTSPNTGLSRKLMNEKVDRKRRIPKILFSTLAFWFKLILSMSRIISRFYH